MDKESLYRQNCRVAGIRPGVAYAVVALCVCVMLAVPGFVMILCA